MTITELSELAHPGWVKYSSLLYYGNPQRGAALTEGPHEFSCWNESGLSYLFSGDVEELQAVVVAMTDPEVLIEEYARRKRRGGG